MGDPVDPDRDPYAPPRSSGERPGRVSALLPLASRAAWATRLLVASFVLEGAVDALEITEPELGGRLWALTGSVALVGFAVQVATAVAFCRWFYRAYANLPALGERTPRFTPGWAIGYFFIPFLNLFRPYQAAKEIWAASTRSPHGLLVAWWALWLLANFAGNANATFALRQEDEPARVFAWVSLVLTIGAAIAAIRMIGRVTAGQAEAGGAETPSHP